MCTMLLECIVIIPPAGIFDSNGKKRNNHQKMFIFNVFYGKDKTGMKKYLKLAEIKPVHTSWKKFDMFNKL